MFNLIREWENSQESPGVFCSERDIRYHIFHYWRRKYFKQQASSGDFIPVRIADESQSTQGYIEIAYPNGTRVRLQAGTNLSLIRSLIGLL